MFKFFFFHPNPLKIRYPLINRTRLSIKKDLLFWNLPIVIDHTNNSSYFYRNRLRLFLFPFCKYFLSSNLETKIDLSLLTQYNEKLYFYKIIRQLLSFFLLKNISPILFSLPFSLYYKVLEYILNYSKIKFNNNDILFIIKYLLKISKNNKR